MTNVDSDICQRLEQLRTDLFGDRGKSRMARELGIRPSTYDRYERDRVPPAELLIRIADVADVTLQWLLTGSEPKRPPQSLDPEGERLARRFEDAIAADPSLRPVVESILDWLTATHDDRHQTTDRESLARRAAPLTRPDRGSALRKLHTDDKGAVEQSVESIRTPASPKQDRSGAKRDASEASDSPEPPLSTQRPTTPLRIGELIPIVGRTSAGPARYWSDLGYFSQARRDTAIASLLGAASDAFAAIPQTVEAEASDVGELPSATRVQLSDSAAGPLEFLVAPELKTIYPDVIAWQIDGDSMEPRYFHGDLVVTSLSVPAVEGQPCVVWQRDQIGVNCKVYHREGDNVALIPINPRVDVQRVPLSEIEATSRVLFVIKR